MNKLPNFNLRLINEKEIKSSKFRKTILFFYPKAMTSGCTIEVCDFQSNLNKFKKLGFEIIGASKDSIEKNLRFAEKYKIKYLLASDEYNYGLNMPSIAQIWKGGCIIRSRLLSRIQDAYNLDNELPNLLTDSWFAEQVNLRLPGLSKVVAGAAQVGIPVPCFSSTLD